MSNYLLSQVNALILLYLIRECVDNLYILYISHLKYAYYNYINNIIKIYVYLIILNIHISLYHKYAYYKNITRIESFDSICN